MLRARRVRWVWCVWVMALTVAARGQVVLGPACGSVGGGAGHGWAVVPEPRGGGVLLLHLPPREDPGIDGMRGAPAGTGRVAARFETAPEAIAAVGDRVYVVFPATYAQGRGQRFVGSLRVLPGGVGDWWVYEPRDRLQAEASLPGEGTLVGLAGTPVGVASLIDRGPRETSVAVEGGDAGIGGEVGRASPRAAPDLSLRVLWLGAWREVELPRDRGEVLGGGESGAVRRRYMLASSAEGVVLLATRPARHARVWTAALREELMQEGESRRRAELRARREEWERAGRPGREPGLGSIAIGAVEVEWRGSAMEWPGTSGEGVVLPTGPLRMASGRLLFGHVGSGAGGGREVVELHAVGSGMREGLGSVEAMAWGVGGEQARGAGVAGVAVMEASRRVAVVLGARGEGGDRRASVSAGQMGVRVVEVSMDTGAVLYDGAMRTGAPLDRDDLQALLVVVMGATGLLLVWAVRAQGGARAVRMPEGSALAPVGLRLMASGVDLVVASAVTGWLIGAPLGEVMSLRASVGAPGSVVGWLLGLVALQGTGVAIGTIAEGLWGRSLGKAVVGLRVVVVTGRGAGTWGGVGLARGLVRNVVRWGLGPVALVGLLGRADGRHLGDRMTGSAVVVRVEEEGGRDEG